MFYGPTLQQKHGRVDRPVEWNNHITLIRNKIETVHSGMYEVHVIVRSWSLCVVRIIKYK